MRVRDRLTAATTTLLQRHGVAGTGIAQILATSGVTRRSIYLNFPGGKAELVAAATSSAGEAMTELLRGILEEPRVISAFTRMWCEVLVDSDYANGCPIVAVATCREEAPEAAIVAARVFEAWSKLFADRFIRDGIDPDVAASLSATVVAAVEGAVVLCRAARTTTPLESVSRHLEDLVAGHRPPTGKIDA